MRYIISGRNITVTEGLKEAIYDKLGKLEKYFTPETEIIVTLSVEKQRQKQNSRKNFQPAYLEMETDGDEEVKIVRTKKFAIKPLDPEEACVEMELLGHSFFVFRNAQTNEVNVVYKRKGNTYGLIEPEN